MAVALALLLIASAAVVVTRAFETPSEASPQAADGDEDESPPTADEIAHAGERLAANGFEVSDDVLTELATAYGVGGAVRIVAWSQADPDRWPIFASCATVTARMEVGWAGARSPRSWGCIPASVRSWATAVTTRVPRDRARIIEDAATNSCLACTASEAARAPMDSRSSRADATNIVVRRLEPQTENVERDQDRGLRPACGLKTHDGVADVGFGEWRGSSIRAPIAWASCRSACPGSCSKKT